MVRQHQVGERVGPQREKHDHDQDDNQHKTAATGHRLSPWPRSLLGAGVGGAVGVDGLGVPVPPPLVPVPPEESPEPPEPDGSPDSVPSVPASPVMSSVSDDSAVAGIKPPTGSWTTIR